MSGEWIDHLSRRVDATRSRRDAIKLVLGSAFAVVTLGNVPDATDAAPAADVGAQRTPPRCRRAAARCKREVRAYCWYWYPSYYGPCANATTRCCNFAAKCKNGRAIDCLRRTGW